MHRRSRNKRNTAQVSARGHKSSMEPLENRLLMSTVQISAGADTGTVQNAINRANAGDTVNFSSGNYNLGKINIKSGINYVGNGSTINGPSNDIAFEINDNNGTSVSGFKFNSGMLHIRNSSANIHDNVFQQNNGTGIRADNPSNTHIDHNTFQNVSMGIDAYPGSNDTFDYNRFDNIGEAIHILNGSNLDVSGNVMTHIKVNGTEIQGSTNHSKFNNNYLSDFVPHVENGVDSHMGLSVPTGEGGSNEVAGNILIQSGSTQNQTLWAKAAVEIAGNGWNIHDNYFWNWGNGVGGPGGGANYSNNTYVGVFAPHTGGLGSGEKTYGLGSGPGIPGMPGGAGAGGTATSPTPTPTPTPSPTPTPTPTSTSTSGGAVTPSGNGLVAQYKFDESSGSTASDAAGNNDKATLAGGASFTVANQDSASGNALKLSGTGQYAVVGNTGDLNPTKAITLSAYENVSDWSGNRRILQKGSNDNQYRLLAENGRLVFDLAGVGSISASLPSAGSWHLVTGTWDGSTMSLYVDGKSVASGGRTGTISVTGDPLVIGAKNTGASVSSDNFKGLLEDVRIYNRALSAAEVAGLV